MATEMADVMRHCIFKGLLPFCMLHKIALVTLIIHSIAEVKLLGTTERERR
jgi:hypothetical protein